jgi:hypothetical protein
MNAWSSTLIGGHSNANGAVRASWTGDVGPRAAEIIRYTYTGWPDADIARFQNMLTTQYLPSIIHGTCENGNKELTMSEALINIGVFNDNRAAFDLGLKLWRGRAPAYIYLKTDGPKPIEPPGLRTRSLGEQRLHSSTNGWTVAEERSRFRTCEPRARRHGRRGNRESICTPSKANASWLRLKFQAQYLPPNNVSAPQGLEFHIHPTWEIAYNHFHDRLGYSLGIVKK